MHVNIPRLKKTKILFSDPVDHRSEGKRNLCNIEKFTIMLCENPLGHLLYSHIVSHNSSWSGPKCSHHFLIKFTQWLKVTREDMKHALGYFLFLGKEQNIPPLKKKKKFYILVRFLI